MVLSIVAMVLMTRKYVENWLLWVVINVNSVMIFARQGVYAMALEYAILTLIALNGSRACGCSSAREQGSRALSASVVMMRVAFTALRAGGARRSITGVISAQSGPTQG